MSRWTTDQIPPQHGRSAVITGTGGLGFEDALALARAGADVTIAGRNAQKGADAVGRIRRAVPGARVQFEEVDLASLASVAAFGARLRDGRDRLDLLINNAAVMAPPERRETADGFELQFGTNYLGHVALTAHLFPLLLKGQAPRVVHVSSVAARDGAIRFDDLQARQRYKPMEVYGQSKLANLLFAFELQRRSEAADWGVQSIAAHPGISRTELIPNSMGRNSPQGFARRLLGPFLFQPAAQGALPTLYAATAPGARGGAYYGPDGFQEVRGYPKQVTPPPQATDIRTAAALWEASLQLADVSFPTP